MSRFGEFPPPQTAANHNLFARSSHRGMISIVMLGRSYSHKVAILLLPTLLAFNVQWSLEVFHPIEERRVAIDHEHSDGGASVYNPSACAVSGHSPHFCSHSNAYARAIQLTSTARLSAHRTPHAWLSETPSFHHVIDLSGRGPPILG